MRQLSLVEQQNRMKEMLNDFDLFCQEHGITYFLAYGTLIGAIRHNDFIPWDDDVDIWVPREDYERLIKYNRVSETVDIVSYTNREYFHPFAYANLVDRKTRRISNATRVHTGQGLFIDLFPLDKLPDNKTERDEYIRKVSRLNAIRSLSIQHLHPISNYKTIVLDIAICLARLLDPIKIAKKTDDMAKKYREARTGTVGVAWSTKAQFPAEFFRTTAKAKFGENDFCVPVEYDKVLSVYYGDYMKLPPENERICLHPANVYWI